jgi:hypothetical protein
MPTALWTNSSPPNATARIRSETIAERSRPWRSTSEPSSGPSSIAGPKSASVSAVAAHAEPKRSYASSSSAT